MSKKIYGVLMGEGSIEDDAVSFDTQAEFDAFDRGVSAGAGMYGGGFFGFYGRSNIDELEDEDLRAKILKAIEKAEAAE